MVKVSVIIPVYNAEKYLKDCVDSLLCQTLTELEFIFVNDGSNDSSPQIIASYQATDSRITLINQSNQGVSVARNNGIAVAQGDYIGFVDADDYLEHDFYAVLYQHSQECDVVASSFISYQDGQQIVSKAVFLPNQVYDEAFIQNEIIASCIKSDDLNSACTKLFKRAFVIQNELFFPAGVTNGEDAQFVLKSYSVAQQAIFVEYAGYHYREVAGSASRNIIEKDYFQKAITTYMMDYKSNFNLALSSQEIQKLKAIRFIHSVVALIHIYFKSTHISLLQRYILVKKMIYSDILQTALRDNWEAVILHKNKYNRFILNSIHSKSVFKLFLATTYSNLKN